VDHKNERILRNALEEAGLVSRERIVAAEQYAQEKGVAFEEGLVQMGIVEPADILQAVAESVGMKVAHLSECRPEKEVIELISKDQAAKYSAIPIARNGNTVQVAISDPFDVETMDLLTVLLGELQCRVEFLLAERESIERALERFYTGDEARLEEMFRNITQSEDIVRISEEMKDESIQSLAASIDESKLEQDDSPIIRLVDKILEQAIRARASDIHFEPFEKIFRVRFRIDGVCQEFEAPPKRLQAAILSRLKLLAGMDLAEKRIPQDGRIQTKVDERAIDFRVNALPGLFGESVVLRILDKGAVLLGLEQVGFAQEQQDIFQKLILKPNGIILITGPTGSGKTTTLYAALNTINTVDRKIITVENPVEYRIEGINQVQINDDIGLTFALSLRTILRQAPNVILVGEIRDQETAEIAIRAALTGHLVFSTLHTNDAPSAATRLTEMGVKPFLIASSVQAVLAQRLVRKICKECKYSYKPDPLVLEDFGLDPAQYEDALLYQGRGCDNCNYSGYKGRTAIFEIMIMSEELQNLILEHRPAEEIRDKAREQGMSLLREDGVIKAFRGETTLTEVARITGTK